MVPWPQRGTGEGRSARPGLPRAAACSHWRIGMGDPQTCGRKGTSGAQPQPWPALSRQAAGELSTPAPLCHLASQRVTVSQKRDCVLPSLGEPQSHQRLDPDRPDQWVGLAVSTAAAQAPAAPPGGLCAEHREWHQQLPPGPRGQSGWGGGPEALGPAALGPAHLSGRLGHTQWGTQVQRGQT